MQRYLPFPVAAILLTLASCAPSPAPDTREADAKALRDGELAAFVKDWSGKDAARIGAHYAADANLIITNIPVLTGKDIAASLKDTLGDPNWSLTLLPVQVEVARSGELAYARGTYQLIATDPTIKKAVFEKGRFVSIFRKDPGGAWKCIQDINNAESPATPK